jgi:hypothetical protein
MRGQFLGVLQDPQQQTTGFHILNVPKPRCSSLGTHLLMNQLTMLFEGLVVWFEAEDLIVPAHLISKDELWSS